jgi:N-methylhydantoinase A/oxoprolinase/acetone carboxylase beta subunit
MKIRIAVDTGGTFTDFAVLDESGLRVHKVRSTPDDPSRAILSGIVEIAAERIGEMIHGSTVATNALLERKGAKLAFVTTAGFEHILHIGRQTRPHLYRLNSQRPRALVEHNLVFGVRERIGAAGEIIEALSDIEIGRVAAALEAARPDAIAICLLHAYAYPQHEATLAEELIRRGFTVSASHQILPEYREFERASTTAVNAYVSPVMTRYLTALEERLACDKLRINQSSGGFISAEEARTQPVRTVLSGPAGGAVGALAIAQASGFSRVIAFDMGGTSTDVSLLDGALPMTAESVIGDFPVRLQSIDIHTVGAGGGSIAFIDSGGALRVGPRSAGAVPGPACYGVGDELTVTDANLLLGRLHADSFLGGRMKLDPKRARHVAEPLAARLKLTVPELAGGVVRIANSNIQRALRLVSMQRGHDPRNFALLAFGGAGGMHACELAEGLDIQTVLVPEHAGILSALGMLLADYSKEYSRALLRHADQATFSELESLFEPMLQAGREDLCAAGFGENTVHFERSLDIRYAGQSYELTVPLTENFRTSFDEAHQKRYGYHNRERHCEIVTLRVKEIGLTNKPSLPRHSDSEQRTPDPSMMCEAMFHGAAHATPLFLRHSLPPGASGPGPAIIAGAQATTVVPAEWQFTLDPVGTLVLTRRHS